MSEEVIYSIPVYYQCWGVINVSAASLEEAKTKAVSQNAPPYRHEYVKDSLEVDEDSPLLRYQS